MSYGTLQIGKNNQTDLNCNSITTRQVLVERSSSNNAINSVGMILVSTFSQIWAPGEQTPVIDITGLEPADIGYRVVYSCKIVSTTINDFITLRFNNDSSNSYNSVGYDSNSTVPFVVNLNLDRCLVAYIPQINTWYFKGTLEFLTNNITTDGGIIISNKYTLAPLPGFPANMVMPSSFVSSTPITSMQFAPSTNTHNGMEFRAQIYRFA
jgi:hypothetical protein